jgi:hypothetical protein
LDSQKIKENGWCQGAVFKYEDSQELCAESGIDLPDGDRLIVLSHDCDVVHSGDAEPNVELAVVKSLATGVSGHNTFGKSPRFLHLEVESGNDHLAIEIVAALRHFIPREKLEDYLPDGDFKLSKDQVAQIRRWLSNKYSRAALPDAFNTKISAIYKNPVRRKLKKKERYVSGLFVALSEWGELGDGDEYGVALLATMEVGDYAIEERRVEAGDALTILVNALSDAEGIDVLDHELRSEAKVSLDERRDFVRLSFDDLSLRDGRGENIPPD